MSDAANDLERSGEEGGRPIIGGRHGSPIINVAFPFSSVRTGDSDLRETVAELADLVARLASEGGDDERRATIAEAARDVASQIREGD